MNDIFVSWINPLVNSINFAQENEFLKSLKLNRASKRILCWHIFSIRKEPMKIHHFRS